MAAQQSVGFTESSIIATQQSGSVTLTLDRIAHGSRGVDNGTVQVLVVTAPSPAVGVNVPAVEQSVTFASGESFKTVSIPIIPGRLNSGEVDVPVALLAVAGPRALVVGPPVVLKIKASPDFIAPTITGFSQTRQGIKLSFSKPMDPTTVQNINNYFVEATTARKFDKGHALRDFFFFPWTGRQSPFTRSKVPLRSATYDAATLTVTLVPARPIGNALVTVRSAPQLKHAGRGNHEAPPSQVLTDAAGNPIDGDTTHPGQFTIRVA